MAKSRRNRAKPRKDPLAKAAKPPSDPELAALREKSILPVIKDLQVSDPKSRTSAAAAISNLVTDQKCRKLLLREQVVHIVLQQTLTDASPDSRLAGWEILRVIAEEEEQDFCVHLYRQDVLTAVGHAAQTVLDSLTQKKSQAETKVLWEIAGSLVALTAALSEAQDEILEAIVGLEPVIRLLCFLISNPDASTHIRLEALSCVMTLVEDNKRLANFLVEDQEPKPFTALLELQKTQGAGSALACGILHNIFTVLEWYDSNPGDKDLSDASLVPTLSAILEEVKVEEGLPAHSQWAKASEVTHLVLETMASIGTSLQDSLTSGHVQVAEEKVSKSNSKKAAAGQDDEDEAMDEDGGEEDKDVDEMDASKAEENDDMEDEDDDDDIEDIQADMEMVTGAENDMGDDNQSANDLATLNALVHKAIPQVIQQANPAARTESTAELQTLALSTLNNIAWSVSCFDFTKEENEPILKLWAPAGKSIWQGVVGPVLAANTADIELASKITSLAWAVARTLPGTNLPLQGDEHQKFVSLYQAAKKLDQRSSSAPSEDEDPFQGLGVKCIGVLGQLAMDPAPISLNRDIGVFLMTVLSSLPDSPVADVVEALNQIFDIYGEEEHACDKEVFWKDNFLGHLEEAQPKVKAMVKTVDKRTHKELRFRADEAQVNLGRFIQYKKKNKPAV